MKPLNLCDCRSIMGLASAPHHAHDRKSQMSLTFSHLLHFILERVEHTLRFIPRPMLIVPALDLTCRLFLSCSCVIESRMPHLRATRTIGQIPSML